MIEKNTVLLDLKEYNNLKKIEDKYYALKQELNNCLTKFNKKGKVLTNGFNIYLDDNIPSKVKINLTKLCKVLDIEQCEIEIIKEDVGKNE